MRNRDVWLWRIEYAGRAVQAAVGVLVEVGIAAALFALAYWFVWG